MSTVDVTTSGDDPTVLDITLADILAAARLSSRQASTAALQAAGALEGVQAEGQAALAAAGVAQAAAQAAEASANAGAQAHGNVPAGGALGQVLTKRSNQDNDYDWETASGGSGSGSGSGSGGSTTLAGLTDVDETTAPTDGQVLTWVGSEKKAAFKALPASSSGSTSSGGAGSGGGSGGGAASVTTLQTTQGYATTDSTGPLPFSAVFDDNDAFNATNSPTRITIPAGKSRVRLTGYAAWEVNGRETSGRAIAILKNGNVYVLGGPYSNYYETGISISSPWLTCTPGDYFELRPRSYDTGGSPVNTASPTENGGPCYFSAEMA